METNLHRSLKLHYAIDESHTEIKLGRFRIDAIDSDGCLVEVQHAGLSAIRDKIAELTQQYVVRLIKPMIATKWIATIDPKTRAVIRKRKSPKQGKVADLMGDLMHFTRVFPNPNLIVEIPMVDVDEVRIDYPRRRRRAKQYKIIDQTVRSIGNSFTIATSMDLWRLINVPVPSCDFDTNMLATWMDRPRWFAQQSAYVLSRCGACQTVGKRGRSHLYRVAA